MSKDAYILRGLPGSGKSTLARALVQSVSRRQLEWDYFIASTDDYFMSNGVYTFNAKLLGDYHKLNQDVFKLKCERKFKTLICDNTNMAKWEMEPYVKAAKDNGYRCHIILVGNPLDPNHQTECAARNSHGISLEIIQRMAKKFEL